MEAVTTDLNQMTLTPHKPIPRVTRSTAKALKMQQLNLNEQRTEGTPKVKTSRHNLKPDKPVALESRNLFGFKFVGSLESSLSLDENLQESTQQQPVTPDLKTNRQTVATSTNTKKETITPGVRTKETITASTKTKRETPNLRRENLKSTNALKEKSVNVKDTSKSLSKIEKPLNKTAAQIDKKVDTHLDQLLKCCQQKQPQSFSKVFDVWPSLKIGEASYSEVYLIDDEETPMAVKVIPLGGQDQLSIVQALQETKATLGASEIQANTQDGHFNFVRLLKSKIVKEKYPQQLLDLWDQYNQENESENEDPRSLKDNQLYLVLFLEFGGTDLEHTALLTTPKRLMSVFMQVILALAQGEEQIQFEHRDLHWGNILVENTAKRSIAYEIMDETVTVKLSGVQVKIIDFTLSRHGKEDIVFNDLSQDPELFEGPGMDDPEGDLQFDVYRWMKDIVKDWKSFQPKTNILWIEYLVDKLDTFEMEWLDNDIRERLKKRTYKSALDLVKREMLDHRGALTK
ncbi:hypothetical protein EDD86DRAFT_203123 [Gorgonomyces haynaldii]|nr:hypothetical protein EDD86DRAFT_203123 [Gorgonomyces haynaldii]